MSVALKHHDLGHKRLLALTQAVLFAGLLATQSRGALVALVVALFVLVLRRRLQLSPLTVVIIAALALFLAVTIIGLEQKSQQKGQRRQVPSAAGWSSNVLRTTTGSTRPFSGKASVYYLLPEFDFPVAQQRTAVKSTPTRTTSRWNPCRNPASVGLTASSRSSVHVVGHSPGAQCMDHRRHDHAADRRGASAIRPVLVTWRFSNALVVIGMGVAAHSTSSEAVSSIK